MPWSFEDLGTTVEFCITAGSLMELRNLEIVKKKKKKTFKIHLGISKFFTELWKFGAG